jgi:hypothetical protein
MESNINELKLAPGTFKHTYPKLRKCRRHWNHFLLTISNNGMQIQNELLRDTVAQRSILDREETGETNKSYIIGRVGCAQE